MCMWGGWVGAKGVVSWARRRGVVGQKLSRRERRRGCRGVKEKGERRRSPFPPFSITGGKTRGPGGRGKTEGVRCRARSRRCVCCCSLPRTPGGRHGVCAGCFARACCSLCCQRALTALSLSPLRVCVCTHLRARTLRRKRPCTAVPKWASSRWFKFCSTTRPIPTSKKLGYVCVRAGVSGVCALGVLSLARSLASFS